MSTSLPNGRSCDKHFQSHCKATYPSPVKHIKALEATMLQAWNQGKTLARLTCRKNQSFALSTKLRNPYKPLDLDKKAQQQQPLKPNKETLHTEKPSNQTQHRLNNQKTTSYDFQKPHVLIRKAKPEGCFPKLGIRLPEVQKPGLMK